MNSVELSKLATKVKFNHSFFTVRQIREKSIKGSRFHTGQTHTINALFAKNLVANGVCEYV